MAGSVLMLVAIIFLFNRAGTFDYAAILSGLESGRVMLSHGEETFLFLAFFIAFAIKVPLFPLHTWLPDAHVEAPIGRFADAGFRHAENGHLRAGALLPADVPDRGA